MPRMLNTHFKGPLNTDIYRTILFQGFLLEFLPDFAEFFSAFLFNVNFLDEILKDAKSVKMFINNEFLQQFIVPRFTVRRNFGADQVANRLIRCKTQISGAYCEKINGSSKFRIFPEQ